MILRRTRNEIAYKLEGEKGSCLLLFTAPQGAQRLELEGLLAQFLAVTQRVQEEARLYRAGQRQAPPSQITPADVQPLISFFYEHLAHIEGLHDERGTPLTVADLAPEDLQALLYQDLLAHLLSITHSLIAHRGLAPQHAQDLAKWLESKGEQEIPGALTALFARYRAALGPDETCPLDAPAWMQDVHKLVRAQRLKEAAFEREVAEQRELAKKLLGG